MDVDQIEPGVIAAIEGLDGGPHGGTWRATRLPGALEADEFGSAHLLFDASIESGELEEPWAGGACESDQRWDVLVVRFLYRERPGHEREDWISAARAGHEIQRALIAGPWRSRSVSGPPVRERLEDDSGSPRRWYAVTVEVEILVHWHRLPATLEPPVLTVPPLILGAVVQGGQLAAWPGVWTGTAPLRYSYQWMIDGAPVPGAVSPVWALTADPDAHEITFEVTASGPGGVAVATSLPVGGGGGHVDCAVSCAGPIADAREEGRVEGASTARAWQRVIEMDGAVWSDPSGLVTSHTEADGVLTATLAAGVVADSPPLMAGWEAPVPGSVPMIPEMMARLIPVSMPGLDATGAVVMVVFTDGPRATATRGIGWSLRQHSTLATSFTIGAWAAAGGAWNNVLRNGAFSADSALLQGGSAPSNGANDGFFASAKVLATDTMEWVTFAQAAHGITMAAADAFTDPHVSVLIGALSAGTAPAVFAAGALVAYARPDHGRVTP